MAGFRFDWGKVREEIQKEDSKKKTFEKDTRFWNPNKKATNDLYIIRFLPDTEGNPFTKIYSHSFDYQLNGQKKYWIKNCINTFGYDKDCPICKKNMELWNSAFESDKAIASKRKRKLEYTSNILVIKDPNNPDNEGKVFLYKYGAKIYEKIKALMFPTESDLEDPDFVQFVPFDLYEGADFKLKVKQQGEFPFYGDSSFAGQKPLGNDKKIDEVMGMTYKLSEFTNEDQFPTNAETIKALGSILGLDTTKDAPAPKTKKEAKVVVEEAEDIEEITEATTFTEETSEENIDSDLDFFNSLK